MINIRLTVVFTALMIALLAASTLKWYVPDMDGDQSGMYFNGASAEISTRIIPDDMTPGPGFGPGNAECLPTQDGEITCTDDAPGGDCTRDNCNFDDPDDPVTE